MSIIHLYRAILREAGYLPHAYLQWVFLIFTRLSFSENLQGIREGTHWRLFQTTQE